MTSKRDLLLLKHRGLKIKRDHGFHTGNRRDHLSTQNSSRDVTTAGFEWFEGLRSNDENPKLPLHSSDLEDAGFSVFEGVGVVRVLEKDVAAAICFQ